MKKLIEEYDLMLSGTHYLDKNLNSRYYNAEGSRAGTIFELYHEDDNLYDPLAIMVLHKGKDIGYIPRDENLEIAYYLYHPEQFVVECRQKKKQIRGDFEMIVVIVKVFAITENYRPFSFEVFDEVFADYDECVEKLAQKRKEIKQEEERKRKEIEREKERKRIEREQKKAEIKKEEDKKALKGCLIFIIVVGLLIALFKTCSSSNNENEYSISNSDSAVVTAFDEYSYLDKKTDTLAILNQRQIDVKNEDDEIKNAYKILKSEYYWIDTEVIRFTALYNKFRETKYGKRLKKTRDSLTSKYEVMLEKAEKDYKKYLENKK